MFAAVILLQHKTKGSHYIYNVTTFKVVLYLVVGLYDAIYSSYLISNLFTNVDFYNRMKFKLYCFFLINQILWDHLYIYSLLNNSL